MSVELRRRTVLSALAAVAASTTLPLHAQAEWRPNRPIRLFNGFAAGGSGDLVSRIIADGLKNVLGQSVVVETRAGASGFIAAEAVARSAPDGYTIGFATMSMFAVAPQMPGMKIPIDVQKELTPIGTIANIFSLMVSAPDAPFKTVPELVAYAKANPGKVTYASAGTGSIGHLAGELFRRQAGVDMVHVPYKGGSQAMIDLQAGRVHLLLGNMSDYLQQVKAGSLRGIAFGGERGSPQLPGLPRRGATWWLCRTEVSVTPTVCSNCAESFPSCVTTVHPSSSVRTLLPPWFSIGSIVKVIPAFSSRPVPGLP
jgi:tripartite-type tricarboxylate transporter receptor subunit TctC